MGYPIGPVGLWASWSFPGDSREPPGRLPGASWAVLARKRWPTWPQVGPQNGPKMDKKSKPKSIQISMPLGVAFGGDFVGLGRPKWSHVGPRMEPEMDLVLRTPKIQKILKANGISMIFGVRGVQIETKNRSKIDQKMKSSWEGILASIFHGFWSILEAKLAPCRDRNLIEKLIPDDTEQIEGEKKAS